MPGVQSLKIYGTCPEFVADVASACPALESLETNDDDDPSEVLVLQPNLRPFMSQTIGNGNKVKAQLTSHGSKARRLESSGKVRTGRETRNWKITKRGDNAR